MGEAASCIHSGVGDFFGVAREEWDRFNREHGGVYSSSGWLGTIREHLDVPIQAELLHHSDGRIRAGAFFVYEDGVVKNVPSLRCITLVMDSSNAMRSCQQLSYYDRTVRELLQAIERRTPGRRKLKLDISHRLTDPRPFQWSGYAVEPKCSLVVPTRSRAEIDAGLAMDRRRQIRVSGRDGIQTTRQLDLAVAHRMLARAVDRVHNKDVLQLSEESFIRISESLLRQGLLEPIGVLTHSGELAGFFLLASAEGMTTTHAWMGAVGREHVSSGAGCRLYYEALLRAHELRHEQLDFDHGNIESVATFKQSFGAVPRTFFRLRQ